MTSLPLWPPPGWCWCRALSQSNLEQGCSRASTMERCVYMHSSVCVPSGMWLCAGTASCNPGQHWLFVAAACGMAVLCRARIWPLPHLCFFCSCSPAPVCSLRGFVASTEHAVPPLHSGHGLPDVQLVFHYMSKSGFLLVAGLVHGRAEL